MNTSRHFTRECTLSAAILWTIRDFALERLDLFARHHSKESQITTDITIVDVDPELVELIRRRALGIEPHASRFCLSEFRSRCVRNEREGERMRFTTVRPPNQLESCSNVSPLITAAALQRDVVSSEQLTKIV